MAFITPPQKENPYLTDPDVLLMLEFLKGDKSSFEKLMERNYKRVLNFIYRFVGNSELAEDLTQEVFIKVYKSALSYRPQAKFQTWLFQIAKNTSLNEIRRPKGQTISLDATLATEDGEIKRQVSSGVSFLASEELSQKETAEMVKQAIDGLPANQRIAVILRRFEDFSYEDIAKTMNCSVMAVKSLLSRAKENLKERLSPLTKD